MFRQNLIQGSVLSCRKTPVLTVVQRRLLSLAFWVAADAAADLPITGTARAAWFPVQSGLTKFLFSRPFPDLLHQRLRTYDQAALKLDAFAAINPFDLSESENEFTTALP